MAIDSHIRSLIAANGYIGVDDLMAEVLSRHSNSYYKSINEIGAKGDFITSPEISQMFGEILALWVIEKWQVIGKPTKFSLVELGPGQGLLMRDLLKITKLVPDFFQNVEVFLYEINPYFIEKQKLNLSENNITEDRVNSNLEIKWIDTLDKLPPLPTIFIANEFFDALPIKQYNKVKDKWYELTFITDPTDGRIKYSKIDTPKALQNHLSKEYPYGFDGAILEESPESLNIMRVIANHVNIYTGGGLFIDYGYNIPSHKRLRNQYHSTLQAIKNHQYHPIIDSLGEADLSAHVDFQALKLAATQKGIKNIKISSQEEFLIKYGILTRLESLKSQQSDLINRDILDKQVHRLTSEKQMGQLFKVMEF